MQVKIQTAAYHVMQQPEPPCTKFNCEFQEKCRDEKLSCRAFNFYAETGASKDPRKPIKYKENLFPTREHYNKIFPGG